MLPLIAIPFPAIDPVAFEIGPMAVRWYGLAYMAGLMLGWWYARRLAAQPAYWGSVKAPTPDGLDDLLLYVAIGIVVGGRLGEVLFYNLPYYIANPMDIFRTWKGGMSFHGGMLGAIAAGWLFAYKKGLRPLSVFDLISVVVPIGLFCGRMANFVNGELWGRATDVPWGMVFPDGGDIVRHPSQLYEAALEGVLLLVILALAVRRWGFRRPGMLGALFIMCYGLARFFVEFFREPDSQLGFLFGGWLTMGMLLSVPMIVIGAAVFFTLLRKPDVEPLPA
jgi:phosphatidylglycerol:prolipoprotein diacylglycerol transferase